MPLFERYNLESPEALLAELTTERDAARKQYAWICAGLGDAERPSNSLERYLGDVTETAARVEVLAELVEGVESYITRRTPDWPVMVEKFRHHVARDLVQAAQGLTNKSTSQGRNRAAEYRIAELARVVEKFGVLEVLEGRKR